MSDADDCPLCRNASPASSPMPHFVRISATRGFSPRFLRYWYDLPEARAGGMLKVYFENQHGEEAGAPEVYQGLERKRFLHWLTQHSELVQLLVEQASLEE